MLCVSSWKNKQILINYNKQKFSLSRCLGWSPESCPCAVTSRVFVRGEPVTEKKRKERNHALAPIDSSRSRAGVCARSSALAPNAFDCCHDWIVNAELALLLCYFWFVFIKRSAQKFALLQLQECPRRRDRLSIDRSSIRPYGRCRSATRTCRPWVLELMEPCGKYL